MHEEPGFFAEPRNWVMIAFFLFFILFGKKLWEALAGMLDARAVKVRAEIEEARALRAEADAMLRNAQKQATEAATEANAAPKPVRWMRRVAPWVSRPLMSVPGVSDPFGTFRLYRITLLRDLLRHAGDEPIVQGTVWAANADLLARTAPLARRIETVYLEPPYDLRPRESRIHPWTDAVDLFRSARAHRSRPLPSRKTPDAAR